MTVRCTDGFVKPHRQVSQRLITILRYGVGSHDDRAGGHPLDIARRYYPVRHNA